MRGRACLKRFRQAADYGAFLRVLDKALEQHAFRVLGYCLIPPYHAVSSVRRPCFTLTYAICLDFSSPETLISSSSTRPPPPAIRAAPRPHADPTQRVAPLHLRRTARLCASVPG